MKRRILIADDSPLVHQIFGKQLEEAGYEVLHTDDGLAAISAVLAEIPDLILLDVHMPKINGYQVCRLLKDNPDIYSTPIVMMTSEASTSLDIVSDPRNWCFQIGADGYVDKDATDDIALALKPFLKKAAKKKGEKPTQMTELEILIALSRLLDKQLYLDVTRLKELDDRKNAFVANVSHEFRSPLGAIKGYLTNLQMGVYGPTSEPQRTAVEAVTRVVDRLNRLVTDLLDLAQIEAGKIKLKKKEIHFDRLIDEMLATYSLEIQKKGMTVVKDYASTLPAVLGDKDRLMQVLINLFSNCLKYTPDGSTAIFRLKLEVSDLRMEIEDNGPGIGVDSLQRIFDKFERISTEKREGTGLGLPIAHDIVLLHQGKIWAESGAGKGTKFVVVLPAV